MKTIQVNIFAFRDNQVTLVEIIINAQTHTQGSHYLLMRNNFKFGVKLHSFLSSAMDEREWLLHTVIELPRGNSSQLV
jgi:hypothetical protein